MDLNEKESILQCVTTFKLFLDKPLNNLDDMHDFLNDVPVFISNFIEAMEIFCNKNKFSKEQQFTIVVYLMQYCSSYELFKNVHSWHTMDKKVIFEVKRCICKQLTLLLDNTTSVLGSSGDRTVGSFLNLMDVVLDKMAEIDVKKKSESIQLELNVISSITEEILCLSMSVAQVAFDDDNKIITAGCRLMLNATENLKTEIIQEIPNIAMCNLAMDTCIDTLCGFEAKVNTAVLRLCLKVFSEYKKPITNLYDLCEKSVKPGKDELVRLVSVFDLHMDRIFQIGLFSIASSAMGKCVADIKNVLANLEFLEGELVPAFVAMTNDSTVHRKVFANTLRKTWCAQVKLLRKSVHSVIEPSAYCKLIYEDLKQKVEELWEEISDGKNVDRFAIDPFFSYTKELGQMFTECMESFNSDLKDGIKNQLKTVYKVLNELEAIRNLLLHENSKESHKLSRRVFKRCQVLLLTIRRLWLSTVDETQKNQMLSTSEAKTNDIKECSTTKTKTLLMANVNEDNPVMDSIIIRSKKILKDRSICHLNQNSITLTQTFKENTINILNGEKLMHLTKYNNFRNCSYRQDKRFVEGSDNISIVKHVHPRIKSLRNEIIGF